MQMYSLHTLQTLYSTDYGTQSRLQTLLIMQWRCIKQKCMNHRETRLVFKQKPPHPNTVADLENNLSSTPIWSALKNFPVVYPHKFGKKEFTGPEYSLHTRKCNADASTNANSSLMVYKPKTICLLAPLGTIYGHSSTCIWPIHFWYLCLTILYWQIML